MIKIRLQGTREDLLWFEAILEGIADIEISEFSKMFSNKGTNRYYRVYAEAIRLNEKKEMDINYGKDYSNSEPKRRVCQDKCNSKFRNRIGKTRI